VVYVSQRGNFFRNDCGPACVLMLARTTGKGVDVTVQQLAAKYDPEDDGTSLKTLSRMLSDLGLAPYSPGLREYPYIVLCKYDLLPLENRHDPRGTFLHWIVRLSDETYHDPYHDRQKGKNLRASKFVLDRATYNARVTTREIQNLMSRGNPRIQYERVYNLVNPDATPAQYLAICSLVLSRRQTVGFSADDAGIGNLDVRRVIAWGFPESSHKAYRDFFAQYYPGVEIVFVPFPNNVQPSPPPPSPPPPSPPPPSGGLAIGKHPALPALPFNLRLGVHTMERVEEATIAFDAGCRSFTVMDNLYWARQLRARGCAVIYRRFVNHGVVPSPDDHVRAMGIGPGDALIVMGLNEADNISTSDLPRRFEWDKAFAEAVWRVAPNCFPVIGSFSMGTPQIENPDVARVWRSTYGAFLNANAHRVGLNYHSYHRRHSPDLPPFSVPVEDPKWWPQRFTTWGYDPQFGGLNRNVILVGDETGVDIAGIGGFHACGYNDDTFAIWWRLRKAEYEPLPQVYVQNVFQFSNRREWDGYHIRNVFGAMTKVWQGRF